MTQDTELWISEEDGSHRRRAKETVCLICNKKFLQRLSGSKKLCSMNCYTEFRSKEKVQVHCHYCNTAIMRKPFRANKTHFHFCNDSCRCKSNYRSPISICVFCNKSFHKKNVKYCSKTCTEEHKKVKILSVLNAVNVESEGYSGKIRSFLIKERGHQCEKCLLSIWDGKPIPVDMHHIDGNHKHNFSSNLQILCKNCHALTDTYGAKNKGNGRHTRRIKALTEKIQQNITESI